MFGEPQETQLFPELREKKLAASLDLRLGFVDYGLIPRFELLERRRLAPLAGLFNPRLQHANLVELRGNDRILIDPRHQQRFLAADAASGSGYDCDLAFQKCH